MLLGAVHATHCFRHGAQAGEADFFATVYAVAELRIIVDALAGVFQPGQTRAGRGQSGFVNAFVDDGVHPGDVVHVFRAHGAGDFLKSGHVFGKPFQFGKEILLYRLC